MPAKSPGGSKDPKSKREIVAAGACRHELLPVPGQVDDAVAAKLAAELWEQVWPLPASAQNRAGAVAASVSAAQGKDGTQITRTKRWTADEAQRFGELMVRSRKDVARVAKELGGGRTIGDCGGRLRGQASASA